MPENHHLTVFFWAARDLMRRPGRSMLLFVCLTSLVLMLTTPLLFSRALDHTWARLVEQAPDLVIRRVGAGGWAPMQADLSVSYAKTVPGVTDVTPRLWGVATGPEGPVTVVTAPRMLAQATESDMIPPRPGQAIVGRLVERALSGTRLDLVSRNAVQLDIVDTFPEETDLITADFVWVSQEDARNLLGLSSGQSSDLAIRLFRKEEEIAIQADLSEAFPWPVNITDRSTSALRHHTLAMKVGGRGILLGIPALLAMLLLITDIAMGSRQRERFWGLLQALGWTTKDLVRVELFKASIIGAPAVSMGMALAYLLVYTPPLAGATAFWVAGYQKLPSLTLDGTGAMVVMGTVAVLVGIPYLAAVFLTSLRSASGDSTRLIEVDSWN